MPYPYTAFPEVIDSTLIRDWRSCQRLAGLAHLEHWKRRDESIHLHAGAAFAKGLEATRVAFYAESHPENESIARGLLALTQAYGAFECPPESAKSLERMLGALEYYFSAYPLGTDSAQPHRTPSGQLGIEFSFVEPINFLHPETGQPVLYSGRFDMIADFAGGIYGEDDKTATSLGASWPRQWDLRSQFTAYTWGARRAGMRLDGFLIRGVSILKTKYDTMEAITYRPDWMVDRWYEQLLREMADMKVAWERGEFRLNLDESCTQYGGCQFRKVCLSPPETALQWLKMDFVKRRWDPVTRTETVMEEV